jgi:hypothetical protein
MKSKLLKIVFEYKTEKYKSTEMIYKISFYRFHVFLLTESSLEVEARYNNTKLKES